MPAKITVSTKDGLKRRATGYGTTPLPKSVCMYTAKGDQLTPNPRWSYQSVLLHYPTLSGGLGTQCKKKHKKNERSEVLLSCKRKLGCATPKFTLASSHTHNTHTHTRAKPAGEGGSTTPRYMTTETTAENALSGLVHALDARGGKQRKSHAPPKPRYCSGPPPFVSELANKIAQRLPISPKTPHTTGRAGPAG